jgi:pimeloyl-ACP methyl ester carboxylesterase
VSEQTVVRPDLAAETARGVTSDPLASDTSITVNGTKLAFSTLEPVATSATTHTVLLLHGLAADRKGLLPLARHLPDARIIAVDLPGHGRSEPLHGRHTMVNYSNAIEAMCEQVGATDIVVVGHSLGASIALMYGAIHPERIRALALLMPVTSGRGPSTWLARAYFGVGAMLPERFARLWFLSRLVVSLSDEFTLATDNPEIRKRIKHEDFRTAALASPRAIQEIYRSMTRTPFLALAARIRVPTLIVGATHDDLAPVRALRRLRDHMRASKLVVANNAGHLWPVEEPAAAANLIAPLLPSD